MNMNRSTGRTFRRTLRALVAASEGKRVVFYVSTVHDAKRSFKSAMSVAAQVIDINTLNYDYDKLLIKFPNDGCVLFRSVQDNLRGVNADVQIVDDYLTEDR